MKLAQGAVVPLTNWLPNVERGAAEFAEQSTGENGAVLRLELKPGREPAVALWEKRLLLPKGRYQVAATVSAQTPAFSGPTLPVTLRLWGRGDAGLQVRRLDPHTCEFVGRLEVQSEHPEEVTLQLRAESREAVLILGIRGAHLERTE